MISRRLLRAARAAVCCLPLGACVSGLRTLASGRGPSIRRDVAVGAREFEARLSARGDTILRRSLVGGARLVPIDGDSVVGADAVAAFLTGGPDAPADGVTLQLYQSHREECTDGALERGRFIVRQLRNGVPVQDLERGSYTLRWVIGGGTARIERLEFLRALDPVGSLRRIACPLLADAQLAKTRVQLIAQLPMGVEQGSTTSALRRAANEQGVTEAGLRQALGPTVPKIGDPKRTRRDSGRPFVGAAARLRLYSGLAVEAGAQLEASEGLIQGLNPQTGSYLVQAFEMREERALLAYQWHRMRVGVGAARLQLDWEQFTQRFVFDAVRRQWDPRDTGRRALTSSTAVVPLAQAGLVLPLTGHVYFGADIRHRWSGNHTIPGLEPFAGSSVDLAATAFGLTVGLAF